MTVPGLRERAAIILGSAAGIATRRIGYSGGTALPGLIASRLAPDLVESMSRQLGLGSVIVTGTNGKTTTTKLLSSAVRSAGIDVLTNSSGSNLERGLVSTYVSSTSRRGSIRDIDQRIGVFEVDEAAFPELLPRLRPRACLFLNLSRDQLDRYGEVDSVIEGWRDSLEADASGLTLVLNADDPSIIQLDAVGRGEVVTFGISDLAVAIPDVDHSSDARFCNCGALLAYDAVYMGHVGLWRCDSCGRQRTNPSVTARKVTLMPEGIAFELTLPRDRFQIEIPLAGLHSVYNALAAAAAAYALGLPSDVIASALRNEIPSFGRQETFRVSGRDVRVQLAKNPAGMNEVIQTLTGSAEAGWFATDTLTVLLILNDGIQDGRDVSWIYDADMERLAGRSVKVVVAGTRAQDMALRMALADVEPGFVDPHIGVALDQALALTSEGGRLDVVPNYTGMLEVREILARQTGGSQYWGQDQSI